MPKLSFTIPWLFFITLMVGACKHEIPLSGTENTNSTPYNNKECSPDSVYFQNTIQPLIVSNCAVGGCHDAISHKEGLVLTTYDGIMRIVSAGRASSSKLVSVIITTNPGDVMPPPPRTPLSVTQIEWIKKWINQGAKNNSCSSCDTSTFTFSGAVLPLLKNKCNGCHANAASGGGVILTTYDLVKAQALIGKLLGSIERSTGFSPMPKGGNKLPECEVMQVRKWIAAGMLNN